MRSEALRLRTSLLLLLSVAGLSESEMSRMRGRVDQEESIGEAVTMSYLKG